MRILEDNYRHKGLRKKLIETLKEKGIQIEQKRKWIKEKLDSMVKLQQHDHHENMIAVPVNAMIAPMISALSWKGIVPVSTPIWHITGTS